MGHQIFYPLDIVLVGDTALLVEKYSGPDEATVTMVGGCEYPKDGVETLGECNRNKVKEWGFGLWYGKADRSPGIIFIDTTHI